MEFKPNATSERFKTQVLFALEMGLFKDYKQIADQLKWNKTALSAVMNSKRNVPFKIASDFEAIYLDAQKVATKGSSEAEKIGLAIEQLVTNHEERIIILEAGFRALKTVVCKKLEPVANEAADTIRLEIEDLQKHLADFHLEQLKKRQANAGT